MRSLKLILICVLLLLTTSYISAQEVESKLPPHIRTAGEAIVTVRPDRAQIDIGVVTQAGTSQAAVQQNARMLESTLAALRSLLGASAEIRTISYSVAPNYRYPSEGGEPEITGYSATNVVRVTLDDLTKVGDVIDAAVKGGSNRIQGLRFMLKDEAPVKAQALREAALKARASANALADALGLKVARVLSVVEGGSPVVPFRDVAFARTETASTPVEPGTIEVSATVALTVEVR